MTRTLARSPQPDARAATVLLDELDAGRLKSGADGREGGGPRRVLAGLKPSKGAGRGRSSFGQLIPAPVEQCSGCPKLCGCYVLFHDIPLANVQKHDIRFCGPQGDRARCSSTPPGLTKDQEGPRPMAVTTNITLGACRAGTAPSRRQLGGATLAALCGVAFAGTVVLPDPGEAFPAAAGPDAELLELCAAIDALQVQADALYVGPGRIENDDVRDDVLAPITGEQVPMIERMCELQPATLQGHLVRARTYWGWDKDPPERDSEYCNEAMQGAILRDLAALAEHVA